MERCGCRGLFLQGCGAAAWLEQSPGTPKARGDPSPEGKGTRGAAWTVSPLDHHSQICLLSPLPALNSLSSPGHPSPLSCFPSHSAEGLQLWGLSFLPWPLQAGWEQWGQVSVVQVNIGLNMWVWWCPVSREGSVWKCWGWGQTGRVPARRIAHSLWNRSAELHRAGAEAGGSAAGGVSGGLLPSQLTHPGVLLQ